MVNQSSGLQFVMSYLCGINGKQSQQLERLLQEVCSIKIFKHYIHSLEYIHYILVNLFINCHQELLESLDYNLDVDMEVGNSYDNSDMA